jgi:hypothetical protein
VTDPPPVAGFIFDNDLPPCLAAGIRALEDGQENILHLADEFPPNTEDEEWLPNVGARNLIVITRDARQRRNPTERAAYHRHRVGAFVLAGKNLKAWDLIEQTVRNWQRIKSLARTSQRPFFYRIPPHGTRIEPLPLR